MPPVKRLLAVLGAVALVVALTPGWARAAGGIEFLDTRPVVVDLDRAEIGQRWSVAVIDGQPGAGHELTLYAVFEPDGVIAIAGPAAVRTSGPGAVARFTIELRRAVAGSGELVVVSGGAVARRTISTRPAAAVEPVPVSALQFAGVRLVPFTDRVRIDRLTLPDAPGADPDDDEARRIGVLGSGAGDVAEVVRRGDEFAVRDAGSVGEYTGSVDLTPGVAGGTAAATLRVRDLPVWPLLVLVLGLALVQSLDRYQSRVRPRRLLELRLARLRDQARAAERTAGAAVRICARPGEPPLLLDTLVADALADARRATTEAETAAWDVDGAAYTRLADEVRAFQRLAESHAALAGERAAGPYLAALDGTVVGEALRGGPITTAAALADATERMEEARTYLREFREIHRELGLLTTVGSPEVRDGAARLEAKLLEAPGSLAGLRAAVDDLYSRWEPELATPTTGVPYPTTVPHQYGPPTTGPGAAPPKGRRRVPLAAAAVAFVLCAGGAFFWTTDYLSSDDPGGGVVPTASPGPSGGATPYPPAPVAPVPRAPEAFGATPAEPGTTQLVLLGVLLPVGVGAAVAGAAWLVARSWRRRRPPAALADLDTAALDRRLRAENLRFGLASAVLVTFSGMSVLYATDATFGSPGDYVATALWGTALGEGLLLARRFLPS